MSVPKIFRSSDVGAPVMLGSPGTLIRLLDACLVDGYGSTFASGTIANDGVSATDGDTFTIGSITYTLKTSLAGQPAYTIGTGSVAIGITLAINGIGTVGGDYTAGTLPHPDVYATRSGNIVTLTAHKGGTIGNSIALSESSTHLTVSGSTLTGGGGTNTKASAGWTKPFTGPTAFAQAVYKQPAGCGFYLQVDDNGPGVDFGGEARTFGFETVSAWNTGTGQFPTVAQNAAGAVFRKCALAVRDVVRPWILIADDRTFYLFNYTGDSTNEYVGFAFGDFHSLKSDDAYKCLIIGKNAETTSALSAHPFAQAIYQGSSSTMGGGGHWLSRNFTGIGGSTAYLKMVDYALSGSGNISGSMGFPNGSDGGLYLASVRIIDASTPGSTVVGSMNLRGRMRGIWHAPYPINSFADGDTFQGSGELAGRNFMVVKPVLGSSANTAYVVIETTAWDMSS